MTLLEMLLSNIDQMKRTGVNSLRGLLDDPAAHMQRSASRWSEENLPTRNEMRGLLGGAPEDADIVSNKINALGLLGLGAIKRSNALVKAATPRQGEYIPAEPKWPTTFPGTRVETPTHDTGQGYYIVALDEGKWQPLPLQPFKTLEEAIKFSDSEVGVAHKIMPFIGGELTGSASARGPLRDPRKIKLLPE